MKKFVVLIVLLTSFVSSLDTTHPTMKTLIQQPSKILTDFQGEDVSSTNNILYGRDARYTMSTSEFDFMNTIPIMIAHRKIYKLKAISENVFEIVR